MKDLLLQIQSVLLPVFLAFSAFISPIAGVLSAVGVFIAADAIFARYRVYVMSQRNKQKLKANKKLTKEEIDNAKWTSRKFRAGLLPKVITYNCFVLSFFMMDKYVINEFITLFTQIPFALTKLLALVLIYIEIKSIDESFEAIKGKSLFAYLIELITRVKTIDTKINKVNKGKEKAPDNDSDAL